MPLAFGAKAMVHTGSRLVAAAMHVRYLFVMHSQLVLSTEPTCVTLR